jgi:hypothetical protein
MLSSKDAQTVYNNIRLSNGIMDEALPWWQLTDNEQKYYRWLYDREEYHKYLKEVK